MQHHLQGDSVNTSKPDISWLIRQDIYICDIFLGKKTTDRGEWEGRRKGGGRNNEYFTFMPGQVLTFLHWLTAKKLRFLTVNQIYFKRTLLTHLSAESEAVLVLADICCESGSSVPPIPCISWNSVSTT